MGNDKSCHRVAVRIGLLLLGEVLEGLRVDGLGLRSGKKREGVKEGRGEMVETPAKSRSARCDVTGAKTSQTDPLPPCTPQSPVHQLRRAAGGVCLGNEKKGGNGRKQSVGINVQSVRTRWTAWNSKRRAGIGLWWLKRARIWSAV